ncbi:MAG: outer membrane lipoprotein carrier protein LolA [Bryobacteraceae bacterium]
MRLLVAMTANILFFVMTASVAWAVSDAESLANVNSRLDKSAAEFQSMSANIEWIDHTKVINEDSRQAGTVRLKKAKAGLLGGAPVTGLIGFTEPDAKTISLNGPEIHIYYPKMKTVQIWDLGRQGDQFFQFVLLGFGTTSADLRRNYNVRVVGPETLGDTKTTRLELKPKTKQIQEYLSAIDLWIPEDSGYPVQEILHQKSGDTTTIRYTQAKFNAPMTDKQLAIDLPAGVKKEYPQKSK